jgi:hypothetical protein
MSGDTSHKTVEALIRYVSSATFRFAIRLAVGTHTTIVSDPMIA